MIRGVQVNGQQMGSISLGLSSVFPAGADAAGIAGNLFAFVLFVSPIPTFRRIIRNQTTEQFSGLPYVYALLNCLICLWYGMPIVTPGIIPVATVNSVGALFQFIYITIFIIYADRSKKLKMSALLVAVFVLFGGIVFVSVRFFESQERQMFIGSISVFSLISMFASPLFIINLVIKSRSVEYMPFYLSLSTFLMSLSFFIYGILKSDPFLYVPNGIGTVLGISQLLVYYYYSTQYDQGSREPLLASYA